MSRSNLLHKLKKEAKISVSQFIRQVRLKQAMEILRQTSSNVSEVSYKVGFSSVSYFIKCFHDYYGYPPGEVGKRDLIDEDFKNDSNDSTNVYLINGLMESYLLTFKKLRI
jgi:AraC-like DNA-binding protein